MPLTAKVAQAAGAAAYPPHAKSFQMVSAARFSVWVQGWTTGLGFTELTGFSSTVEHLEYSYNSILGNFHSRQFGRAKPPTVVLKRGLDQEGFRQLFRWHMLSRTNVPLAKASAALTIYDSSGQQEITCTLENAWCSKLELDSAQAGNSNVIMIKVTIECDSIQPELVGI